MPLEIRHCPPLSIPSIHQSLPPSLPPELEQAASGRSEATEGEKGASTNTNEGWKCNCTMQKNIGIDLYTFPDFGDKSTSVDISMNIVYYTEIYIDSH